VRASREVPGWPSLTIQQNQSGKIMLFSYSVHRQNFVKAEPVVSENMQDWYVVSYTADQLQPYAISTSTINDDYDLVIIRYFPERQQHHEALYDNEPVYPELFFRMKFMVD
jgi:hypothetical protein